MDVISIQNLFFIRGADDLYEGVDKVVVNLDNAFALFDEEVEKWRCTALYTAKVNDNGQIVHGDIICHRYYDDETTMWGEDGVSFDIEGIDDDDDDRDDCNDDDEFDEEVKRDDIELLTQKSNERRARSRRFERKRDEYVKRLKSKSKKARIIVQKQTERKDAIRVRKALAKSAEKVKEVDSGQGKGGRQ